MKQFRRDVAVYDEGAWRAGVELEQAFVEGAYAGDGEGLYLAGDWWGRIRRRRGLYRVGLPRNVAGGNAAGSAGGLHGLCRGGSGAEVFCGVRVFEWAVYESSQFLDLEQVGAGWRNVARPVAGTAVRYPAARVGGRDALRLGFGYA